MSTITCNRVQARARGHSHERHASHAQPSGSSAYETIEEEMNSTPASRPFPYPQVRIFKATPPSVPKPFQKAPLPPAQTFDTPVLQPKLIDPNITTKAPPLDAFVLDIEPKRENSIRAPLEPVHVSVQPLDVPLSDGRNVALANHPRSRRKTKLVKRK